MAGRGVYRAVYSSLPDDPDFQRLSAHARLVFYTARICKQAGPAVIFRYYPELLARQTGLTGRQVEAALVELERGSWIYRNAVVLWVRNGLRHDPTMRLSNGKHRRAVEKAIDELPRLPIVLRFCDYYGIARPFDSPSIPSPDSGRVGPPNTDTEVVPEVVPEVEPEIKPEVLPDTDAGALTKAPVVLTDDQFMTELRANSAYAGIDVDAELARMDAWLLAHPARKKTRRFVVNWLNRADKPMQTRGGNGLVDAIRASNREALAMMAATDQGVKR